MNDIYRIFMRVGKSQRVLGRFTQIDKGYVSFADAKVLQNEPGKFHGSLVTPATIFDWYLSCIQGGMQGVFNVCNVPLKELSIMDQDSHERNGEIMVVTKIQILY